MAKQNDGQDKGSRPRQVREGIARRRPEVSTARDQNNFERRRKHHEEEIQADPGQVPRQLAVAQPVRELGRRQHENAKTSQAGRSQEQLGIRNIPARIVSGPGNEVIQAGGHPHLGDENDSRKNQEELLIRAELSWVEDPRQNHGNEKRRGKSQRASGHQ